MPLLNLASLKAALCGGNSNQVERETLRELLISVLAKGSRADLHTDENEIAMIQSLVAEHTGEQLEGAEIRTAAIMMSDDDSMRGIAKLAAKVSEQHKLLVINALRDVILADDHVSHREIDYFNAVAAALRLSYADAAGLAEA